MSIRGADRIQPGPNVGAHVAAGFTFEQLIKLHRSAHLQRAFSRRESDWIEHDMRMAWYGAGIAEWIVKEVGSEDQVHQT